MYVQSESELCETRTWEARRAQKIRSSSLPFTSSHPWCRSVTTSDHYFSLFSSFSLLLFIFFSFFSPFPLQLFFQELKKIFAYFSSFLCFSKLLPIIIWFLYHCNLSLSLICIIYSYNFFILLFVSFFHSLIHLFHTFFRQKSSSDRIFEPNQIGLLTDTTVWTNSKG